LLSFGTSPKEKETGVMPDLQSAYDACFGSFPMGKTLLVENRRLGLCYRLLQIGAIIFGVWQVYGTRSWNIYYTPVSYGLEAWTTEGDSAKVMDDTVKHCQDVAYFQYNYSDNWRYQPSVCEEPGPGEGVMKRGSQIFIATYNRDNYAREVYGHATCETLQTKCLGIGGAFENLPTHPTRGHKCRCSYTQQTFVKNPEQHILDFHHGYLYTDQAGANHYSRSRKDIVTRIVGVDGKECSVSGDSSWDPKEAKESIRGSLEEWLRCAGVSLDDANPEARSNMTSESGTPRLRVTGMVLNLQLVYHNAAHMNHDGLSDYNDCEIRVKVLKTWNSEHTLQYDQIPDRLNDDFTSFHRHRVMGGISVTFSESGEVASFEISGLLNALINVVVILGLPATVIRFIALYGVGRISAIYYKAHAQTVNISSLMETMLARLLIAKTTFNKISGGEGSISQAKLQELIAPEVGEEATQDALARLCVKEDDAAEAEESLSKSVFLQKYFDMEVLDLADLEPLLNIEKDAGCLEKLFGESRLFEEIRQNQQIKERKRQVL